MCRTTGFADLINDSVAVSGGVFALLLSCGLSMATQDKSCCWVPLPDLKIPLYYRFSLALQACSCCLIDIPVVHERRPDVASHKLQDADDSLQDAKEHLEDPNLLKSRSLDSSCPFS